MAQLGFTFIYDDLQIFGYLSCALKLNHLFCLMNIVKLASEIKSRDVSIPFFALCLRHVCEIKTSNLNKKGEGSAFFINTCQKSPEQIRHLPDSIYVNQGEKITFSQQTSEKSKLYKQLVTDSHIFYLILLNNCVDSIKKITPQYQKKYSSYNPLNYIQIH